MKRSWIREYYFKHIPYSICKIKSKVVHGVPHSNLKVASEHSVGHPSLLLKYITLNYVHNIK